MEGTAEEEEEEEEGEEGLRVESWNLRSERELVLSGSVEDLLVVDDEVGCFCFTLLVCV